MRFRHGLKVLSENRGVYVEARCIELHGRHFKGDLFAVGLFEKEDGVRGLVGVETDMHAFTGFQAVIAEFTQIVILDAVVGPGVHADREVVPHRTPDVAPCGDGAQNVRFDRAELVFRYGEPEVIAGFCLLRLVRPGKDCRGAKMPAPAVRE